MVLLLLLLLWLGAWLGLERDRWVRHEVRLVSVLESDDESSERGEAVAREKAERVVVQRERET